MRPGGSARIISLMPERLKLTPETPDHLISLLGFSATRYAGGPAR